MDEYEDLIDDVSNIVRDYGGEILDRPKFWNGLSESYRFSSDYSLRNAYKMCLAEGYVAKIASLRRERKSTLREISNIVDRLKKQSYKEEEGAGILFSIAMSLSLILLVEGGIFAYGPIKHRMQEREFLRKKGKVSEASVRVVRTPDMPGSYLKP